MRQNHALLRRAAGHVSCDFERHFPLPSQSLSLGGATFIGCGEFLAAGRHELVVHGRREAHEFLQCGHDDLVHRLAAEAEVMLLHSPLQVVAHAPVRGEDVFHYVEAASRGAVWEFPVLRDDAFQAPNQAARANSLRRPARVRFLLCV